MTTPEIVLSYLTLLLSKPVLTCLGAILVIEVGYKIWVRANKKATK